MSTEALQGTRQSGARLRLIVRQRGHISTLPIRQDDEASCWTAKDPENEHQNLSYRKLPRGGLRSKEKGRGNVLPALGSCYRRAAELQNYSALLACCVLPSAYCLLVVWRDKPAATFQRAGLKAAATSVHTAAAHAATMTVAAGTCFFFLLRNLANQRFGGEHE